jgi:hypothetical protein
MATKKLELQYLLGWQGNPESEMPIEWQCHEESACICRAEGDNSFWLYNAGILDEAPERMTAYLVVSESPLEDAIKFKPGSRHRFAGPFGAASDPRIEDKDIVFTRGDREFRICRWVTRHEFSLAKFLEMTDLIA